jgi:GTP cyclohydrolase II/3,4-dihydroxy 2-butanone 4-phosphate synthase/GTP cyclohydrolase II
VALLSHESSPVSRYAEADVPTEYGPVRTVVYRVGDGVPPEEHVALVVGDVASGEAPVLTRVHSECWTGEVLHSHKCDCREQLDQALHAVSASGRGVVVYLRQEGRGIGLGNKVRAYALQSEGVDTVDANRILGFADDARTYGVAAAILRDLGVSRVALMTNNPSKVKGLVDCGIEVTDRVALKAQPNEYNAEYLAVKAKKMGHAL